MKKLFNLYVGDKLVSSMDDLRSIKVLAEVYSMVKDEPVKLVNTLSGNVVFRG